MKQTRTSGRGFRPEIGALLALAVIGVVLFQLHPASMAGRYVGVVVVFAISGFLITSHLFRELETTGRVRLSHFLPAASGVSSRRPPSCWSSASSPR